MMASLYQRSIIALPSRAGLQGRARQDAGQAAAGMGALALDLADHHAGELGDEAGTEGAGGGPGAGGDAAGGGADGALHGRGRGEGVGLGRLEGGGQRLAGGVPYLAPEVDAG